MKFIGGSFILWVLLKHELNVYKGFATQSSSPQGSTPSSLFGGLVKTIVDPTGGFSSLTDWANGFMSNVPTIPLGQALGVSK